MDAAPPSREDEHREAANGPDGELPPLPQSLIPRWLAAVVLVLLFASGIATAWIVLTH